MNLKSKNMVETNKYELEIEVNAEEFEAAVEIAFQKNRKKVKVDGFRQGKAPRKMIEKLYGEGVFYDDAINAIYPKTISDAVDAAELEIVDRPDVEVVSVSKEDGVLFKAVCIVKPEVEVADYKGIEVEKTVNEITEDNINAEIDKLRQQGTRVITVEDRAAQIGDDVVIDFEGFLDNVAFEGGKGDNFTLGLGSGQFIPGFEEKIVGHNIGEEFDIDVTFPEEYQAPDLAGKAVVFKIKLNEIKAKELPEFDDEYAKDVTEFNTVDEVKADIKKRLTETAEKIAESKVEGDLMDKVVDGMKAEIPEVMFEKRIDEMTNDFAQRLAQQGLNMEMYLQYTNMDMAAFRKTFEEQAQKQVKLRLALEKIAVLEKIEVSDADVDAEYAKISEQYKVDVEKVKSLIFAGDLKKDISVEKAVELIKNSAKIK